MEIIWAIYKMFATCIADCTIAKISTPNYQAALTGRQKCIVLFEEDPCEVVSSQELE